jgi:NTE family protein
MKYTKLVFSGGGMKGIAFIGVLKVLEQYNIINSINTYLGCSAGSIIALLVLIGYTHNDLYRLFTNIDLAKYQDLRMDEFLNKKGIDSGENFMKLITIIVKKKGITAETTFEELFKKTGKSLIVVGSNITRNNCKYFNHIDTPNAKVLQSIRISISYPYFFQPVVYEDELYVDGGLLNHFPIKYFGEDCMDVLGILLHDRKFDEDRINLNHTIEDYTLSLLSAVIDNVISLITSGMEGKYIHIDIKNLNSMNFHEINSEKIKIYLEGIKKTRMFFDDQIYKKNLMHKYFKKWKNFKK